MRNVTFVLTAALLCSPLACKGDPDADAKAADDTSRQQDGEEDADEDDDEKDNPFAAMTSNPLAAMFTNKLNEPGPYDPPKTSDNYDESAAHIKVLKLSGSGGEVASMDPMSFALGGGGSLQTRALLTKLDELAAEDKLEGLVVRVGDLSLDVARAKVGYDAGLDS